MERTRGPSLASSPAHNVTPAKHEGAGRPRRKLQKSQKGAGQLLSPSATKLSSPRTSSDHLLPSSGNRAATLSKLAVQQPGPHPQPALLLPPDLSDSKWLEYIRGSGFLCAAVDTSTALPTASAESLLNKPTAIRAIVPELAHLSIKDAQSAQSRPSLDSKMSTESPPSTYSKSSASDSPASSTSTLSTMRRRAKTPVFAVGQLEGLNLGRQAMAVASKPSGAEHIAEQYRALLGTRDRDSMYSDSHSEPSLSRQGHREAEEPAELRRQRSVEMLPSETFEFSPKLGNPTLSPTSDDGTLVAFDEETVYFKPISFTPEPLSPVRSYDSAIHSPQLPLDNLSLQICLDLLTRELSTALSGRPNRVGTEVSSLQIWVMIEAYERLRDQMTEMRLRNGSEEMRGVEAMFDTWLQALYSIHDSLAGDARNSESDYETVELGEPLD